MVIGYLFIIPKKDSHGNLPQLSSDAHPFFRTE